MPLAPLAQLTCPRLVCMWPLNTRNPFPCFVPACLRPTATCRRVVLAHLHRRQHWCRHIPSSMVCNKDVVGSGSPPDPECRLDDTYTPPGTCGQHTGGGVCMLCCMLPPGLVAAPLSNGACRAMCVTMLLHVCSVVSGGRRGAATPPRPAGYPGAFVRGRARSAALHWIQSAD